MALLGFVAFYALTFLICAVLHLVRQIDAWSARESRRFPRIATMWFVLAAIGSLVMLGVNSRPRTYEHLGGVAPLDIRVPTSAHLDNVLWVAPLLAVVLGALARYAR